MNLDKQHTDSKLYLVAEPKISRGYSLCVFNSCRMIYCEGYHKLYKAVSIKYSQEQCIVP